MLTSAELTSSNHDRWASGRCRCDEANSAVTNSHVLGEENSFLLEVIIQSHYTIAQVQGWIGSTVICGV